MTNAVASGLVVVGLATLVVFGATVLGVFNIPINIEHVVERGHTDALTLLPAYQAGICEGKWVGYNITSGTVLVACGVPDTSPPQCLLVGYRVTENMGASVLVDDAYNTTAYVDYCYKAYNRAGFLNWNDSGTWVTAPLDLKAAIISAYGEP